MALTMPKENSGEYTLCPTGNHTAICVSVIDLGTQVKDYAGEVKERREIRIEWEVCEELRDDGSPFKLWKTYTFSSSQKSNLRKDLESWRGVKFTDKELGPGGFQISDVLGKPCLLNVVHTERNGNVYPDIASLARLPKGMPIPVPANELLLFSLEPSEYDASVMPKLHEKVQEIIRSSPEWAAVSIENNAPLSGDEDIPF